MKTILCISKGFWEYVDLSPPPSQIAAVEPQFH